VLEDADQDELPVNNDRWIFADADPGECGPYVVAQLQGGYNQ
jgi:hypothetical protein